MEKIPKIAIGEDVYYLLFYDGLDEFEVMIDGIRTKIKAKLKEVTLSYNKVVILVNGKVRISFKSLERAIIYLYATKDTCDYFGKHLDICIGFV